MVDGVTVDERAIFARNQTHNEIRATGKGKTHDIGEAESLPLLTVGTPPDPSIR